jgi:sulfonate transport system substrate-binding protein
MRLLKPLSAISLVAVLAVAGAGAAAAADPVKIRAGWVATPASLIPILFAHPGLAKHQGVSYDFQPVFIGGSPPQITGIAAGEIEIATLNFASFPIAVENAKLTDLKIIADETQDGYDGYATAEYMVLKDSPYKKAEDLKGKTMAVNVLGAGVDLGLRAYLLKHNMEYKRDYNTVEVSFPNMKAELLEHKIDLMTGALPFIYDPELVDKARVLFTLKDALSGTELSFWLVRGAFLQQHRAALVDLLEDMVRSYRWYSDPANHKEAVEILAKFTKRPVAGMDWAFTKKDTYRDPNGLPNVQMMQQNIDTVEKLGFIKEHLDASKYLDLSLVKEAAARIK